jgi:hypothetical protein
LNPETYINVEVNLFHVWEDSNLYYDADGFSSNELYRDLSPWRDFEKHDWELGRSKRLFSVTREEVLKGTKHTGVFSNKLKKQGRGKTQRLEVRTVRSKGK